MTDLQGAETEKPGDEPGLPAFRRLVAGGTGNHPNLEGALLYTASTQRIAA
jgi:hypothetical protein